MFTFGKKSRYHWQQLHVDLQLLLQVCIRTSPVDFSITDSYRNKVTQNAAFESSASNFRWPDSKHNTLLSHAFHADPAPIKYPSNMASEKDKQKAYARYHVLATIFRAEAQHVNIHLRWGGDWNGSWDTFRNKFDDLAHYELYQ